MQAKAEKKLYVRTVRECRTMHETYKTRQPRWTGTPPLLQRAREYSGAFKAKPPSASSGAGWGHLTRDRRHGEAADQTVFCLTGGDKETVSLASEQSSPSPLWPTSAPWRPAMQRQIKKVGKLRWTSKDGRDADIHHYEKCIVVQRLVPLLLLLLRAVRQTHQEGGCLCS